MSPKENPLRHNGLSPTVHAVTASELARLRIKEELCAQKISQRTLADMLTRRGREVWTQSRVGKLLTGRVELKVDDLALVAAVLKLHSSEFIRDRGLEFYAELSPTEVQLIERIRHGGPNAIAAVHWLLGQLPKQEPASQALRQVGQTALRPVKNRATKSARGAADDPLVHHGRSVPAVDVDPATSLAALRAFIAETLIPQLADAATGAIPDRQVSDSVPDEASKRGVAE